MTARMLILAALALTPFAASAHDDAHQGMMPGTMHGKAEGGHSGDGGHAQGVAGMMGKVSVK
jgi:hypothetical protein